MYKKENYNVFENCIPVAPMFSPPEEELKIRREELLWSKGSTGVHTTIPTVCPYCGKEVAAQIHIEITSGHFSETRHRFDVVECPACMRPIIMDMDNDCSFPPALPFENVKNLPEIVQVVYDECRKACGSGCHTASVLLARTLLNHVAVDQGAEENLPFKAYVDYLVENYMPPKSKTWVDSIRSLANESVHDLEIMKKDDAYQIIKFAMYLLKYIYELPNELI